jgi:hypothetical protein
VPFPFAADDHQTKNAEVLERAGAAILSSDKNWTGEKFFEPSANYRPIPARLRAMGRGGRTDWRGRTRRGARRKYFCSKPVKASKALTARYGPKQ